MSCFHPLSAWRDSNNGGITFNEQNGTIPMRLPCGQCIGCRLEYSRQWAIRCIHEASLYDNNCFITLTYDDEHLPPDKSLHKSHFQKFMKRLRKRYTGTKIRYYHCGEYGDKLGRPHYHAILFNFDFKDKVEFSNKNGIKLYISQDLAELWPQGFNTIGAVTFESAAYVARYIMKKINGKDKHNHYIKIDQDTGEFTTLQQEYATMSRRPGIAHDWYQRYKEDIYPSDFITHKGMKLKPPKYYDNIYKIDSPEQMDEIKHLRMKSHKHKDNTKERLIVRETCKLATLKSLKRELHNE